MEDERQASLERQPLEARLDLRGDDASLALGRDGGRLERRRSSLVRRPAPARASLLARGVDDEGLEPGAERAPGLEAPRVANEGHERLLSGILRRAGIAEDAPGDAISLGPAPRHDLAEGLAVAFAGERHEQRSVVARIGQVAALLSFHERRAPARILRPGGAEVKRADP